METIENSPPVIDLSGYWATQEVHSARIKTCETALEEVRKASAESDARGLENIIRQLDEGKTTGNPLTDEALRCFGLHKDYIDNLLAFNARLVWAIGKECLILTARSVRYRYGGDIHEGDFGIAHSCTLGILSGKSLIIDSTATSSMTTPHIILPFERYARSGYEIPTDNGTFPGVLQVTEASSDLRTSSLLAAMAKSSNHDPTTPRDPHATLIFIGDELPQCDMLTIEGRSLFLTSLRATLHAATKEEIFIGGEI